VMFRLFRFDKKFYQRSDGTQYIAGVDEAGRGPLAGPVVAAAVILPAGFRLKNLADSKKLTEIQREKFYQQISNRALCIGIGAVSERVIDRINILRATFKAMRIAIGKLNIKPDLILVDGPFEIPNLNVPQKAIIAGDSQSAAIACASIIAKVTRDRVMYKLDRKYPRYCFCRNKGYPTKEHKGAIKLYGLTEIHRKSFSW